MSQNAVITRLPAKEIRKLLSKKQLSPVEIIEASLHQVQKYNLDDAKKLQRLGRRRRGGAGESLSGSVFDRVVRAFCLSL